MGFIVSLDANDTLQTVHMDKQIHNLTINPIANDYSYAIKL